MSTIAKYEFSNSEAAQIARDKISYEIGSGAAYVSGNILEIQDESSGNRDIQRSAEIAKANGGRQVR